VRIAARAPGVAAGGEHVEEAARARRGHHPAAAGGGVAPVALLHGAVRTAAALHGGRGHGRRGRGRAAALEPRQGRLHLLDRAHAVVRRRRGVAGRGHGEQVQVPRARVLRQGGQLPGLRGAETRVRCNALLR
jgi:hypothetical protein